MTSVKVNGIGSHARGRLSSRAGEGEEKVLNKEAPPHLLYTIFHEKGTPFVYLLLTNGTPFIYHV